MGDLLGHRCSHGNGAFRRFGLEESAEEPAEFTHERPGDGGRH